MANVIEQFQAAEAAKLRALAGLHRELGYGSAQELAAAVLAASASLRTAVSSTAKSRVSLASVRASKGRRIDSETKRQIAAALEAGQMGAKVARRLGVSYRTVQYLKTELGLVKKRRT
jgi:DNA-binding NarL/FixJ family response regulator